MVEFDCKTPANVAESLTGTICVKKTQHSLYRLAALGFLAGAYIAFGAIFATLIGSDASTYVGLGISKLLMGMVFSVGLVLVVICGAELFTGNNLILMSVLDGKAKFSGLLKNWIVVYLANFAGAMFLVYLMSLTGLWNTGNVAPLALKIANAKVNLTFVQALARGIGANWLVCLAVWLGISARQVAGKIMGMAFAITAFVAMGFEHSIANMYFIPAGLLMKNAGVPVTFDLANLTWTNFVVKNLIPVTIGNIIGGALLVGTLYWTIYVRKTRD